MRYIISENQYRLLIKEDRVEFLRKQNVIDRDLLDKSVEGELEKTDKRNPGGLSNEIKVEPIESHEGIDIAYIITNKKGKQSIKLDDVVFNDIVDADPSPNKQYVQWMIKTFLNLIKVDDMEHAIRFLSEDLPEANEFLTIFDEVKNKKIFKRSAPNRPNAPQNVSDINQYKDLPHLYSVISPFIGVTDEDSDEEGGNKLWASLKKFIDLGEAKLAYRDNNVLVYTPLTIESSCEPLGDLSSWCTRRKGNTFFDSYRSNNRKPDGSLSDYYVIFPKKFFTEGVSNLYPLQFHFETSQLHDKNNASIERNGGLEKVLSEFPGLREFFKKELGALAEMDIRNGSGLMDSKYIKYLNIFGGNVDDYVDKQTYNEGVENIKKMASKEKVSLKQNKYLLWLMENIKNVNIVDFLDVENTTNLDFSELKLKELPDLSKFYNLDRIVASNCGLEKLPTIDKLPVNAPLTILSFHNNNITEIIPSGWDKLSSIYAISVKNNPINKINVDEIEKIIEMEDFIRFAIDIDNVMENLTPENREEFQNLLNGNGRGIITNR